MTQLKVLSWEQLGWAQHEQENWDWGHFITRIAMSPAAETLEQLELTRICPISLALTTDFSFKNLKRLKRCKLDAHMLPIQVRRAGEQDSQWRRLVDILPASIEELGFEGPRRFHAEGLTKLFEGLREGLREFSRLTKISFSLTNRRGATQDQLDEDEFVLKLVADQLGGAGVIVYLGAERLESEDLAKIRDGFGVTDKNNL
jgi:hypothetical protein